jgi:hypothetical protein
MIRSVIMMSVGTFRQKICEHFNKYDKQNNIKTIISMDMICDNVHVIDFLSTEQT